MDDPHKATLAPSDDFERETTTDLDDETPDRPKGLALHTRILIGLGVGVVAGVLVKSVLGGDDPRVIWVVSNITEPIGTLFLRLLLMIVVPLVFSSLVVGVAGIGDVRKLGRIGLKCFVYTLVISAISVVIGLTLANTIRPGERIDPETRDWPRSPLRQRCRQTRGRRHQETRHTRLRPDAGRQDPRPVESQSPPSPASGPAKKNRPIRRTCFISCSSPSCSASPPRSLGRRSPRLSSAACKGLFEISCKIIDIIMKVAPYAVACLLFNNTARFGLDLLNALGWFFVTAMLGFSIHMFGVYSLSVYFLSRINPLEFFRRIKTVMLTALSTSSSNATLPTALRVSEKNLGVPREINAFVLTVGATANQNGTALYEGVTVLFLAQLAGVDLTVWQQLGIAYFAILGGIGTAGVPSGSIPFIIVMLATYGINPALIAIILGVDRILDMCRTVVNVTGDLTVATYVARSEGFKLLGRR